MSHTVTLPSCHLSVRNTDEVSSENSYLTPQYGERLSRVKSIKIKRKSQW